MRTRLTVLLYFALISTTFGHALWIVTEPTAALGAPHTAKIYYGEYNQNEFEKIDKWYSDVNKFALWLTAPDGTKSQLSYTAAEDHYVASFTPDQKGTYFLTVGHSAGAVSNGYVYQFNASAVVQVGKGEWSPSVVSSTDLYIGTEKNSNGKSGVVKAYYKGQPAADIVVTVSGPSGWSKSFKTDKNGAAVFEVLWKGTYALEGVYTSDEKGTMHEKEYEHIWRCATTQFESGK